MDISEIIESITLNLESEISKVKFFVIEKVEGLENIDYLSFKPTLDLEIQKEMMKILIGTLDKLKNKEQQEFNENGRPNGVIEKCNTDFVEPMLAKLISSLQDDQLKETLTTTDKKEFYCIRIEINTGEYIYFINRIPQFKKFAKGIWGTLIDSTFRKMNDSFIGIEPNFDIVIFRNEILVVNNASVQRIFDLKTKYIQNANQVLEAFKESDKIDGFENFRIDCIEDGNIVRRISRLLQRRERMDRFVDNFNKVEDIINEFDLNIELNLDKTKIQYTDKKQLNEIVKLLNDAYYKTVLTGEKGIDELR